MTGKVEIKPKATMSQIIRDLLYANHKDNQSVLSFSDYYPISKKPDTKPNMTKTFSTM